MRLQNAIQHQHGCASKHVITIPLTEQFKGRIVWQGEVVWFARSSQGKTMLRICL